MSGHGTGVGQTHPEPVRPEVKCLPARPTCSGINFHPLIGTEAYPGFGWSLSSFPNPVPTLPLIRWPLYSANIVFYAGKSYCLLLFSYCVYYSIFPSLN